MDAATEESLGPAFPAFLVMIRHFEWGKPKRRRTFQILWEANFTEVPGRIFHHGL